MKNNFIAFIPVRGGSKGIPDKNIKKICGQPLVYWAAKAANDCEKIEKVYISTDSKNIKTIVESFELPKVEVVNRSKAVSTDTASTESVMLEFANKLDFKNIILIQATSPLLETEDLNKAIKIFEKNKYDSLLSLVKQKRFLWNTKGKFVESINYNPFKRPRRQEFEGFFVENGSFYITSKESLIKHQNRLSGRIGHYEMPEDTYYEIDNITDWVIAESLKFKRLVRNIEKTYDFNNINLLICDVDGVLTDGGMYYSKNGETLKKFNTKDGKGIELIKKCGVKVMFLTGENTDFAEKRAKKLKIDFVCLGIKDKIKYLKKFFKENASYSSENTAYIGDDVNDIESLNFVYFSAAPADAAREVKQNVKYVCLSRGGKGCVREICNLIVNNRNV